LLLDQQLPRLKQVIFGQKLPEFEEKFEKIEVNLNK